VTEPGTSELSERETIVFAQSDEGAWLAVHEHLSPAPEATAAGEA
jgi:ketosteroid isomerase-like protein